MLKNYKKIYTDFFKSSYINDIKNHFIEYFGLDKISNDKIRREELFTFSKSKSFMELYYKLSHEIVKSFYENTDNILLQPSVTVRLFEKNSHGTSFHTDYLYGHGEKTNTIWVPIYGLAQGNSFKILKKEFFKKYKIKDIALKYDKKLENSLLNDSFEVLPKNDECVIFNSKVIHGSPLNNSKTTRYSFDFRISSSDDLTSTKKIDDYLILDDGMWKVQDNKFEGYNFLKYICGGVGKDTAMQHEIIEYSSKVNNFKIVGQEAEIERYGFNVFKRHLSEKNNKNFNAIVISSDAILDEESKLRIKKSHIRVFSVMQGVFLDTI